MKKILEIAIRIAEDAHSGQSDKAGHPYIAHPMRVMNNVSSIEEKIVAILHDVMEDTAVTADDLRKAGIPEQLISELEALTHFSDIEYDEYIKHVSLYGVASTVKLADLKDNMDITRLNEITDKDIERLRKYHRNYLFLKENKTNT
ncbi:MAG: GTP pyrophosphokinase [Dysgonomonas sp.]